MPNIEIHAPGSFCWFELGATDQNAAKQFYSSLLGWTGTDSPMGPNEFYRCSVWRDATRAPLTR